MLHRSIKQTRIGCAGAVVTAGLAWGVWVQNRAHADDWPGFRGPQAKGVSAERGVFSGADAVSLSITWKKKIGSGYSGIAVVGGNVVTMYADGERDVLVNLDANSGRERWRYDVGEMYKGHDGSHDGPIATPMIHDGRIFGLGPRGKLFCLDLKDGKEFWATDLAQDHEAKPPFYGFGTSPLIHDGVLIVEIGAENAMVAGFDPATGEKLWTVGDDGVGYQSPVANAVADPGEVLVPGSGKVYSVQAKTGAVSWHYDHSGGGGRGSASLVPVPAGKDRLFLAHKDDESCVIALKREADAVKPELLWQGRAIRNSYNVPVYHQGHLYAYSSRFLTCVEVETGNTVWRSRQPGDGFLILVDDYLIIATKKGTLHVAPATPSGYQEKTSLEVFDDLIWTHPTFANGSIFVRGLSGLARVDVKRAREGAVARVEEREGMLPDSRFGRFVKHLEQAEDRTALLNQFMSEQESFPILEGKDVVHFAYRGPGQDLALAGDLFGARQERPMHRVAGTDLFYYSTRLDPDARLNYVFMRDFETITDPRNTRETTTTLFDEEMEMSFSGAELKMSWFAMPAWHAPAYVSASAPAVPGRVETKELESKALETKVRVDVYVPSEYDASGRRYRVLYIHGGESAIKHGQWPVALDRLIGARIEPVIAVFSYAVSFRQADKYEELFVKELIPLIDETYRTVASAEGRIAIGAGFAAVDAWYCALKTPNVFGAVGTQSMFMFDSFSANLKPLLKNAEEQPLVTYMDWGKYDFRNPHEAWDLGSKNRDFAELLKSRGFRIAGGEVHDGTGWPSWRNRFDVMLASLLPPNQSDTR